MNSDSLNCRTRQSLNRSVVFSLHCKGHQSKSRPVFFAVRHIYQKNQYSYLLQTENECLCTLDFIDLPCFAQGFLNDISIVIVVLGKNVEKTLFKSLIWTSYTISYSSPDRKITCNSCCEKAAIAKKKKKSLKFRHFMWVRGNVSISKFNLIGSLHPVIRKWFVIVFVFVIISCVCCLL